MDSILESVKKILGIPESYTHFDIDIIMHINTVLFNLTQIGIGPENGFLIYGSDETWDDFLGNSTQYEAAKSFVALKVRLLFDPPSGSAHMEAIKNLISEYEWRLNASVDYKK